MYWYLVHTKPRREIDACINLERQGYQCYLPKIKIEKLRKQKIVLVEEAMFASYLFARPSAEGQSLSPIRSTIGVSNLVRFGIESAKIDNMLITYLQEREAEMQKQPRELFRSGERLVVLKGPYAGLEVIYQMPDAGNRALVLLDILNKSAKMKIQASHLGKITG
jgi:transcriptional antiterminator RfaH